MNKDWWGRGGGQSRGEAEGKRRGGVLFWNERLVTLWGCGAGSLPATGGQHGGASCRGGVWYRVWAHLHSLSCGSMSGGVRLQPKWVSLTCRTGCKGWGRVAASDITTVRRGSRRVGVGKAWAFMAFMEGKKHAFVFSPLTSKVPVLTPRTNFRHTPNNIWFIV